MAKNVEMRGDVRRILILRTAFSCADARESTKEIDERTSEITLKWGPETRARITTVRNKYMNAIRKPALDFYGLFVIKEADRDGVVALASEADKAMREIDGSLHAHIHFIPLYLDDKEKGEVYGQVLSAIQSRIYGDLFERLKELAKMDEIPQRSRTALLKLVERMHTWNVVDDPDVKETLEDIRRQIEADIFKPVMKDLKDKLETLKERGAFLEFGGE